MEDPPGFGALQFPSLRSCPEQLSVDATYRQKEKKNPTPQQKKVEKKTLKLEETNEISSFIPSGQWHR